MQAIDSEVIDISDLGPTERWIVREQVKRLRVGYHVYGEWSSTKKNLREALDEMLDFANYVNAELCKLTGAGE